MTVRIDSVSHHLALERFLTIFWHGDPWLLIEFICHKSIEIQMSNRKTVHNYVLSHLDAFWPMKINCFDWSLNRRKTTFIDHNIKILLLPHDFRETRSPNIPVYQTADRFTCPPVGCRWWARKRFGFFFVQNILIASFKMWHFWHLVKTSDASRDVKTPIDRLWKFEKF